MADLEIPIGIESRGHEFEIRRIIDVDYE